MSTHDDAGRAMTPPEHARFLRDAIEQTLEACAILQAKADEEDGLFVDLIHCSDHTAAALLGAVASLAVELLDREPGVLDRELDAVRLREVTWAADDEAWVRGGGLR